MIQPFLRLELTKYIICLESLVERFFGGGGNIELVIREDFKPRKAGGVDSKSDNKG
jgi:hypothetical protein